MIRALIIAVLLPIAACSQVPDLGFWEGTPAPLSGCKTWRLRIEPSLIVNLQIPISTTDCFGQQKTIVFNPSSVGPILRDVCSIATPTTTSDLVSSITDTGYDCDGNLIGIPCNEESNMEGKNEFPAELMVYIGPTTGTVDVDFTFGDVPDKMVLEKMDGTVLLNTGWRGSSSYQSALNQGLSNLGLPPETITSPGTGTVSFNKDFIDTQIRVKVYTSYFLGSSSWWVTVHCPD